MNDVHAPGMHLYADQLGQGERELERAPEHAAWTTPRTWTTGEVVTASMMNTHVRDNLNYLNLAVNNAQYSLQVGAYVGSGEQSSAIVVNGATQAFSSAHKVLTDFPDAGSLQVQLRAIAGFAVSAVGGASAGILVPCMQETFTVPTGGTQVRDIGSYSFTPALANFGYDSGWVNHSDTQIGINTPCYRFTSTGGPYSVSLVEIMYMIRAV